MVTGQSCGAVLRVSIVRKGGARETRTYLIGTSQSHGAGHTFQEDCVEERNGLRWLLFVGVLGKNHCFCNWDLRRIRPAEQVFEVKTTVLRLRLWINEVRIIFTLFHRPGRPARQSCKIFHELKMV
jgi:hypothetical protein